jgi:hypothetical protein
MALSLSQSTIWQEGYTFGFPDESVGYLEVGVSQDNTFDPRIEVEVRATLLLDLCRCPQIVEYDPKFSSTYERNILQLTSMKI